MGTDPGVRASLDKESVVDERPSALTKEPAPKDVFEVGSAPTGAGAGDVGRVGIAAVQVDAGAGVTYRGMYRFSSRCFIRKVGSRP